MKRLADDIVRQIYIFNNNLSIKYVCRKYYFICRDIKYENEREEYAERMIIYSDKIDDFLLKNKKFSKLNNVFLRYGEDVFNERRILSSNRIIECFKKFNILNLTQITIDLSNQIIDEKIYKNLKFDKNNLEILCIYLDKTYLTEHQLEYVLGFRSEKLDIKLRDNDMRNSHEDIFCNIKKMNCRHLILDVSENDMLTDRIYHNLLKLKLDTLHIKCLYCNMTDIIVENLTIKNLILDIRMNEHIDYIEINNFRNLTIKTNKTNSFMIKNGITASIYINECISYNNLEFGDIENLNIYMDGDKKIIKRRKIKKYKLCYEKKIKMIKPKIRKMKLELWNNKMTEDQYYMEFMYLFICYCYNNFEPLCVIGVNNNERRIFINRKNPRNYTEIYDEGSNIFDDYKVKELERITGSRFYYGDNLDYCDPNDSYEKCNIGVKYNYTDFNKMEYIFTFINKMNMEINSEHLLNFINLRFCNHENRSLKCNICNANVDIIKRKIVYKNILMKLHDYICKNMYYTIFGNMITTDNIFLFLKEECNFYNINGVNMDHRGYDHTNVKLFFGSDIYFNKTLNLTDFLYKIFSLKVINLTQIMNYFVK